MQEKHLKEKESQKCWQLSEVPEIQEALEEASREEGELLEALCRVRKTVEAFLTDRAELPEQRISMVLALCHDVQNQIGKYETEKIEEVCEKFEKGRERLKKQITEDMAGGQMGNMHRETRKELQTGYLQLLDAWEPVTDTWPDFYEEYLKKLEQTEEKTYRQERKAFEKQWRENFQEAAEQLAVAFQFTYLLGACYDRNLWGKAVLTAYSYLIIKELCFGIYLDGGTCQMTDLLKLHTCIPENVSIPTGIWKSWKNCSKTELCFPWSACCMLLERIKDKKHPGNSCLTNFQGSYF